ncbi:MAG: hypothetical protein JW772_05510 [Candidatus Diapherotrites archaeon]|nr:hypothetical protein [Candidatus Diapherotrites archaeon]
MARYRYKKKLAVRRTFVRARADVAVGFVKAPSWRIPHKIKIGGLTAQYTGVHTEAVGRQATHVFHLTGVGEKPRDVSVVLEATQHGKVSVNGVFLPEHRRAPPELEEKLRRAIEKDVNKATPRLAKKRMRAAKK